MTLYFAYGANMSRRVMRRFAPGAHPLGPAQLPGHRFVITVDGYASVAPQPGGTVHGVAWTLTPRDRVALDGWENVAAGLYRAETLPVCIGGRRVRATVYIGRPRSRGLPRPGYMELVAAAAHEWGLPADYGYELKRAEAGRWRARMKSVA